MAVVVKGQVVARVANEQMAQLALEVVTQLNQGRANLTKPSIKVRILIVEGASGRRCYFVQRVGW